MINNEHSSQSFFIPWPFLALGIVGVIAFILMLPLILGAFAVVGVFSGYLIWRVNKFFRRIEADHMWNSDEERQEYADKPIIEIMPSDTKDRVQID
ncbi:conserved hypothetical protein, secreted [Candidatus Magnetomorum sp. HK-1]|nr:conserved hypothetical protein, secreted [Candidatus Magnetomorum sp. HK-1]